MNIINNTNTTTAELVFIPMPAMGHLMAAMELSKLILARDPRISITMYIINRHVPKISSYVESHSLDNPHPTRFTLRILPALDPLDPLTNNFFSVLFDLHKPLVKNTVMGRVETGSPKPAAFILDMFATTMIDVADELDIPCYIFYTSGANFLSLMLHAQGLADYHGADVVTHFSDPGLDFFIPGFNNPITSKFVPALLQNKESCLAHLNHARGYRHKMVKGILVNTFMELETSTIQALMSKSCVNEVRIPSIYSVGPILELNGKGREGGEHDLEIMQWLDDQPKLSVVFICFGSVGCVGEDQVQEIASALDKCGQRFVWTLRKPPAQGMLRSPPNNNNNEVFVEALPMGFLERTAHKGKVIAWAPQISILAHPAIGGFVSHCGWNSTLEALWFGVPIGTWPIHSEQQLNAFELVVELRLGVDIAMDYKRSWRTGKVDTIVKAEEIEIGINKLMGIDEVMRQRVREMKEKSREVLDKSGSSYDYIGCFIQDVLENVVSSKLPSC